MNERHPGAGAGAVDDHDRGLIFDLHTLSSRRRVLGLFAGVGLAGIVAACGGDDDSSPSTASTAGSTGTSGSTGSAAGTTASTTAGTGGSADVDQIPQETAGPFPGDGSNGPNVLAESDVVRSDITTSFGEYSGTAEGVPLTINMTIVDADTDEPLPGAAAYVWHCDTNGAYSLYSEAATDQNYLRGVQEAGDDGTVSFTSIFPACYSGRWPHVHFEVYSSLDDISSAANAVATSQIALPEDTCNTVYATDGYEQSVSNIGQVSLAGDNVFSDGAEAQTPTVSGDAESGYTTTLTVGV